MRGDASAGATMRQDPAQAREEIAVDPVLRRIEIVLAGPLDLDRATAFRLRLRAHPQFDPRFAMVIDLREADASGFSAGDLRIFAAGDLSMPGRRRAYIARDDGDAPLYSLMVAYLRLVENQDEVAVFRDRNAAVAWIDRPADERR